MGGADTEVGADTKKIILECASFDMYSIRRTSMAHGLFSDAVTRFSKGQSPGQNDRVLAQAIRMLQDQAGAKLASPIVDDNHYQPPNSVKATAQFINQRLGSGLDSAQVCQLLKNVEIDLEQHDETVIVTPPFWRTDINIPEDLVEEIGRLYGYDKLPQTLPMRDLRPADLNELLVLKNSIRLHLRAAGANELLNYSFIHGNLLAKVGQDCDLAYKLSNALSPDLQYYRLSILPSLLEKIHLNIKAGISQMALFEIGKVHAKNWLDEDNLPKEGERLGFVFAADDKVASNEFEGSAYFQARFYLSDVLNKYSIQTLFIPLLLQTEEAVVVQMAEPFEPSRSAIVTDMISGQMIGIVGDIKASVKADLKLPEFSAGYELDISKILKLKREFNDYVPLPRYPRVEQDISLRVESSLPFNQLFEFVVSKIDQIKPAKSYFELKPLDIYQRTEDQEHVQFAFRLRIASYEKTLKASDINDLLDEVAAAANQQFGAERL